MSNLISRDATLKHIEKIRQDALMIDDIRESNIIMRGMNLLEEAVRNQPSAQPERCEDCENFSKTRLLIPQPERKVGKWILDEDPHDGDCRCSACWVAIDQMHERNHGLLNALTGGKWWTFYKFCPNCGADMRGDEDE